MNTRLIFLALLLLAAPIHAAPFRVTTWDLQPGAAAGANGWSNKSQDSLVHEAAESLKKLHPDVIILQQVAGWDTCHQLAQDLQPETYQVAACSSFRDPRTKLPGRQVAILSKARAYLSWTEPWLNAPGGFAFAAIRLGDKNIGIFSVQCSDAREESARQLVKQIASLQNWRTNRLQGFIVAGDFNTTPDDLRLGREKTLSVLEQAGFENALAGLPLEKRVTPDYIFTRDAGRVAPAMIIQTALSEHYAVTCQMDLAAPKATPAPPPAVAQAESPPAKNLLWLAGILAGCILLFVLARIVARRPALRPASTTSTATAPAGQIIVVPPSENPTCVNIVTEDSPQTQSQTSRLPLDAGRVAARMPGAVRAGIIANLSRWLKHEVVQRLMSDRAQLLATQQAAARKMQSVDERLSKIERQIKLRNQEYEQRIDDLLKALVTAREENRELIRAKIALLKAELEKSRRQAGQHSEEHQQY